MSRKVCPRCEKRKNRASFNANSAAKDGLGGWCKECNAENCRHRHKLNRDAILKSKAEFYQANKERIREQHREYRQRLREVKS